MSAFLPSEVDLDYIPSFSILDEPDETESALKKLTDWDFEDADNSFADEEELFPIQEFKSLGSRLFESSQDRSDGVLPQTNFVKVGGDQDDSSIGSNDFKPPRRGSWDRVPPPMIPAGIPGITNISNIKQRPPDVRPKQLLSNIPSVTSLKHQKQADNNRDSLRDSGFHDDKKHSSKSETLNNNLHQVNGESPYSAKYGSSHKILSSFFSSPPKGTGNRPGSFSSSSSSSSPRSSVVSPDKNGSYLPGVTPTGSLNRRRPLKLVCDIDTALMGPAVYPPFRTSPDSIASVSFRSATWDIMMRNFCIALESNSVFTCDKFLGSPLADEVFTELEYMKSFGVFDRHLFRPSSSMGPYASVFLLEEEDVHRRIDGLALMVYKLARYYSDTWKRVSVQLSHFPAGQPAHRARGDPRLNKGRVLKCVYFPNRQTGLHPDEGVLKVKTNSKVFKVEPVFDRLVAYWCDALEHKVTFSSTESYLVSVWMVV